MTSPAKSKGNSWERDCAKLMTKIFGYHFERNKNGSGSFTGGKNAKRKEYLSETQLLSFMADVLPPDEMKRTCIECKFYKDFPFHHLLINKEIPELDDWIEQQLDCINEDSFWFIAFKINRCGSFIAINESLCDFLDERLKNHSVYYHKSGKYIITELEEFLTTYKEEIFEHCK